MRRWPDGLPHPVGRGYALELADTARRTQFEVAVRARRITTVRRDRPTLAARLTDPEFAALRAWWGDEAWSLAGASDSLAAWTLLGATRLPEAAAGPDLALCDLLAETTATGEHRAEIALADPGWAATDPVCATVTLAAAGRTEARVALVGRNGAVHSATLDLASGSVTATSGAVLAVAEPAAGWTRLRLEAAAGAGSAAVRLRINALAAGAASYTGSGAAALAIGQVNARRGRLQEAVFVPTGVDGAALGAAGGSAWFRCPVAVGGGILRREVLPLGPLRAEPRPSLAWEITLQVEARDA